MAVLAYLFILFVQQNVLKANPKFFPCDSDVNYTQVDCSQRLLTYIPPIKSDSVLSLNLNNNKIQKVQRGDFSNIQNLKNLSLVGNCQPDTLQAVEGKLCKVELNALNAFKDLTYLCSLDLSGNSLTSLPWLPHSLIHLNLESNHIFKIIHPLGTPHLQDLLLTSNCVHTSPCQRSLYIHDNVFKELSKLRVLRLGYNNFTSVPMGLPPSLTSLDLRENTITEVLDGAFANLTNLKELNLEWNCQRCDHAARRCVPCPNNASLLLHKNSFYAENSAITYLSLRGNSLRSFPEGLFLPLRQLKLLDLSDNFLAYAIRNGTFFAELRGLTWINLIYNYEPLKTFSELELSPHLGNVSGLEHLLLSGNFFQNLSTQSLGVISKLGNLRRLELRMNFITSCNISALGQLPALNNLTLSQNMLTFLPGCHDLKQHGDSMFLPQKHLQLAESMPSQSYENQNSYSVGYQIPDLLDSPLMLPDRRVAKSDMWEPLETKASGVLEDSASQIKTMWDFRYESCNGKLTFDLSENDILFLTGEVLRGMEKAVCLDLSYNYMSQTLIGGLFQNMPNLVYLTMSYNRIDLYYREAFSELNATLKVLDLSNNDFHFRMKGMGHRFEFITKLNHLEVLSLANNKIETRIDPRLSSKSLKYLYFSGNNLETMWGRSGEMYNSFFEDLTNLIYLDISQNGLSSIPQNVLCHFPKSLRKLSISQNKLGSFPWENISALANLQHLNLSRNSLTDLPRKVIEFRPELTLLDLSHNNIDFLPEDFFSKAQTLRDLRISFNYLKQLNHRSLVGSLNNVSALQELHLHGNPFECDCYSSDFVNFLYTTTIKIPLLTTDVKCEFPESLQGHKVLSIDLRSCQEIYGSLAFLFTFFLAMAFTVLPLLKHLYGWDLWYCVQVLWAGLKGYTQLSATDSRPHYNAFVVFDKENQAVSDWVYNHLIVHLEDSGQRRFCLCVEERDWVPGLSCIENLHNSIYGSMKTVFVLTSGGTFAGSGGQVNGVIRQAFYMVQQRLLDEKVDVTVLVLLDEVFPKLKYLQLRKRLCRKSVLSWPRNPQAQPLFWNRMRMLLSSDNLKFYDSKMSESFI